MTVSTQTRPSASSKGQRSQVSTTPNAKLNKNEISRLNKEPPEKKSKKDPNYNPSVKPAAVKRRVEESTIPEKLEEEILCYDDKEQEDPSDYAVGGFYPVMLGDLFHERYYVLCKLGWGTFSTVWLCWDLIGKRYVALKIVKSNYIDTKSAQHEIKNLRCVGKRKKIVQLLDDFKVTGVNGTHICIVFEVLGHSILKFIRPKVGIPLPIVKTIIRQVGNHKNSYAFMIYSSYFFYFQVLEGLDELHTKCGIVHTDIKPENILVCVDDLFVQKLAANAWKCHRTGMKLAGSLVSSFPQNLQSSSENTNVNQKKVEEMTHLLLSQLQHLESAVSHPSSSDSLVDSLPDSVNKVCSSDLVVKIVDLGSACCSELISNCSGTIQTRPYRCLESLICAEYGPPVDIWSTACMAFELATGDYLFFPEAGDHYSKDEDHLALITELLGEIPKDIWTSGKMTHLYFTETGGFRNIKTLEQWGLCEVLIEKYRWLPREARDFAEFLHSLLAFDPKQRATASECLLHPWLTGA